MFQIQKLNRMADISNAELKKEIQGILKDADLDNTSAKKVGEKTFDRSPNIVFNIASKSV